MKKTNNEAKIKYLFKRQEPAIKEDLNVDLQKKLIKDMEDINKKLDDHFKEE